ncbi:MAG: hypothetical protein J2P39_12945, partial [Candidatus Dormibacteraeota bacterium]|nr:hypothetical protein [Candidatus Dormibacteraeota bacterium]
YLSWRNPRIKNFDQYLLYDPLPAVQSNDWGQYASGLLTYGDHLPKADYSAYRLPLYLPRTSTRRGGKLEVWGCVRPALYANRDSLRSAMAAGSLPGPQVAYIQFQRGSSGPWTTLRTVNITSTTNCYFDMKVAFPASGQVRLAWYYPPGDQMLGNFAAGQVHPVSSRSVSIRIR